MRIWLDDLRPAPEGWVHVKTATECIYTLIAQDGNVEEISLDHDLGGEYTGYDVLTWLEEEAYFGHLSVVPPRIGIHTDNPVGYKRMKSARASIERIRNEALSP